MLGIHRLRDFGLKGGLRLGDPKLFFGRFLGLKGGLL